MCRISGFVGNSLSDVFYNQSEKVKRSAEVLIHGGPDGQGFFNSESENVFFSHCRLSILDLSEKAHQPMLSDNGKIIISYNGEVYNFKEIRQKLIGKGISFHSDSDTEVILKSYQTWGEESFSMFSGMFAFALLDEEQDLFYLVRDGVGIKPLYYGENQEGLYFSSELKSFPVFDPAWEENTSWRTYLLLFGHIPEPFTTLDKVSSLPKGSFLKYHLPSRTYAIKKFQTFHFSELISDEREALRQVREAFSNAVQKQLISDAPIGVFLSGGIDSSLISIIASQFVPQLNTLSINFNETNYSEKPFQDIVQKKINSKHYSFTVTERDFRQQLPDIFAAMDQPTTDGINTYFVSKLAKESGLKVVLSGLGGDEIFGGYPSFFNIERVIRLYKLPSSVKKTFASFDLLDNDKYKKFSFLQIEDPLALYLLFRGLFTVKATSRILGISEREVKHDLEKLFIRKQLQPGLNPKNLVSWLETNLYMQNQLLKDTDVMSMWNSLETRVPFLDKELLKVVFSIHPSVKYKTERPKYLITKAFEDLLPWEITYRQKKGFTFPFKEWMQQNIGFTLNEMKRQPNAYTQKLIKDFQENKLGWARFWSLVLVHRD